MTQEQRWAEIREQTPVLREYAYMNTGWSGPLSTPVGEAMRWRGGQRGNQSLSRAKHAFSRCGFLYPGSPTPLHADRDLDTRAGPLPEPENDLRQGLLA